MDNDVKRLKRCRIYFPLIFVTLFLTVYSGSTRVQASVSIDDRSSVTTVVDGDTFYTSKGWAIRLADIDAPESWESGYSEAKVFLESLLLNTFVYLDVDPLLDPYDRYVCLAYVQHNATHFLNVNFDLVLAGHAVVQNYTNNIFDPATWTRYVAYSPIYLITVDGASYTVTILSNSTISDLQFSQGQKQLSFNVSGSNTGYCNVTIPKDVLGGEITVFLDDIPVSYTVLEDDANSYVYFMYSHSTHGMDIVGTTVIPEFPTMVYPLLLLAIASVTLFILTRKRPQVQS